MYDIHKHIESMRDYELRTLAKNTGCKRAGKLDRAGLLEHIDKNFSKARERIELYEKFENYKWYTAKPFLVGLFFTLISLSIAIKSLSTSRKLSTEVTSLKKQQVETAKIGLTDKMLADISLSLALPQNVEIDDFISWISDNYTSITFDLYFNKTGDTGDLSDCIYGISAEHTFSTLDNRAYDFTRQSVSSGYQTENLFELVINDIPIRITLNENEYSYLSELCGINYHFMAILKNLDEVTGNAVQVNSEFVRLKLLNGNSILLESPGACNAVYHRNKSQLDCI